MVNRLGAATSPYLLQHAANPVHWWEWGADAFAAARERDVPVLLSVGYATCHWCHVMAHESFQDPVTAEVMNRWFVSIKVDREERPDVDRIYMDAVQAATGRGGWPMTVFLTSDGEPFFAGTYFPPSDRPGMPSFTRVLTAIHEAWDRRRSELVAQAQRLATAVAVPPVAAPREATVDTAAAASAIRAGFDPAHGGFGAAPKFPQVPTLEFLLARHALTGDGDSLSVVTATLRAMAAGGIHDHLGGGFARYSVDGHWTVPHFEKMLSDNAQLVRVYARTALVTGDSVAAAVARDTAAYLLRDLRLPDGGFASGEDADSEGEEGTFYVFAADEVEDAAPDHAPAVAEVLGVTATGSFEGRTVLRRDPVEPVADRHRLDPAALEASVAATLENLRVRRSARTRPARDDKVVTAWNGLAIRGLADAGMALGDPALITAAIATATFVLGALRSETGRLHRSWRDGRLGPPGFCDDYAALAAGCWSLYQTTGDERWYREAASLTEDLAERFADPDAPGFFATGHDADRLLARPKNVFDLPTPSDNALAAEAMLAMAVFTGEGRWWDRVDETLRLLPPIAHRHPTAVPALLTVSLLRHAPPLEVALVGPEPGPLLGVLGERYRPAVFLARGDGITPSSVPLLRGRPAPTSGAAAHVCRGFVCDLPIDDPEALRQAL